MRKFLIIRTNCDCASGLIASVDRAWKYGPRCPHCGHVLGIGSYRVIAEIKAKKTSEALFEWKVSVLSRLASKKV